MSMASSAQVVIYRNEFDKLKSKLDIAVNNIKEYNEKSTASYWDNVVKYLNNRPNRTIWDKIKILWSEFKPLTYDVESAKLSVKKYKNCHDYFSESCVAKNCGSYPKLYSHTDGFDYLLGTLNRHDFVDGYLIISCELMNSINNFQTLQYRENNEQRSIVEDLY